jgi:hypothetical protein
MKQITAFLVALALASPALALGGKPKKGKKDKDDAVVVVTFTTNQRSATQEYFVEKHGRGHCPPGLAKKNNGCLPPGQAKKRYVVGHPLPPDVVRGPLPPELNVRIGAPPPGYVYAVVDGDLVKLAVGTAMVVDAIQGLVN